MDSDGEKRKSTRRWLKGKGFNAMVWVWVWVLDVSTVGHVVYVEGLSFGSKSQRKALIGQSRAQKLLKCQVCRDGITMVFLLHSR